MRLSGGAYSIRPSTDDHIRVTLSVSQSNPSKAALTIDKTSAKLTVEDTPKNNFNATIEVPKASDLVIRLSGGDLKTAAIAGNKDIETGVETCRSLSAIPMITRASTPRSRSGTSTLAHSVRPAGRDCFKS